MILTEAIEGFVLTLRADGYSHNTVDLYIWALDKLTEHLSNSDVEDITLNDLRGFMIMQSDAGYAGSSVENMWKAIRTFFGWCANELGIERPDGELKRPRYAHREIVPFTEDEIRKLLTGAERTRLADTKEGKRRYTMKRPTAKRDSAIIMVLLDTGLRIGELGRLKVEDVNLQTGEVKVHPYGTGRKTKGRTVFIGKAATMTLWKYLQTREDLRDDDPLFLSSSGKAVDRNNVRHVLNHIGKQAGVSHVHPHRFRHTFAIQFIRNGGDIFTLQRLLGHSSLEMVRHYLLLADTDTEAAHRRASPADRWRL